MNKVRRRNAKDPKSPWVVDYHDASGKRCMETPEGGKKKDAEAISLRIKNEMAGGRHISRSRALSVKEIAKRFLLHSEQRVADGRLTRGSYVNLEIAIRKTILPGLGSRLFIDLRPADVEDFYTRLVQSKALSPLVARQRISILKRVQDFAIKRDLAKERVVDDALRDLRGIRTKPIKRFTMEEAQQVLVEAGRYRRRAVVRMTVMGNVMVHLAALCGLRFGEITGLTLKDIDFDDQKLRIRHSMSMYDGHKGPKSAAGIRDFPMPDEIVTLLREWVEQHQVPNDLDLVFTSRTGGKHSNANFHVRYWQPLMKRLGMRGHHFHALRHFAASMLCKHVPLTDVPALLGHATLDTTLQVYAHEIAGAHVRASAIQRIAAEMKPMRINATNPQLSAV